MTKENNVETLAIYEKLLKETAFMTHGRGELLEAMQHHPDSPYKKQHDHPLKDHIDAVQRDVARVTAIIDEILKGDLTSKQRDQIEKYAAERERYVNDGLMPACDALLSGKYTQANEILLEKSLPPSMPALDDDKSPAEVSTAERTICDLSLFFGAAMAASFLAMVAA